MGNGTWLYPLIALVLASAVLRVAGFPWGRPSLPCSHWPVWECSSTDGGFRAAPSHPSTNRRRARAVKPTGAGV